MLTDTSRSLLDRLQNPANEREWDVFYKIYQPFIRQHLLVRKVPVDDADDLTQEILSRVFRSFATFVHNGRPGAFRKWLGQIVSQQVWRFFQALEKSVPTTQLATPPNEVATTHAIDLESQWELEHDRYCLKRLLELIRPEFTLSSWQAFQAVVIEGKTPEQAAEQLNISVNAVVIAKSRIFRRLRILGKDLIDTF